MAGRLKSGDLLPTENELAAQLGVNRSTVREGIRALENADLIARAGKRLVVRVPRARGLAWVNTRALGLMHVSFLDLWELQTRIEPFAAGAAAERISPDLAEALRENVARLAEEIEDDDRVIDRDLEFHRLVAQAAGNAALGLVGEPLQVLLFSATLDLYRTVPQARHRLLAAHRAILAGIERGDADAARRWMARHIEDFRRGYEVAGFDLAAPIPIGPRARERFG